MIEPLTPPLVWQTPYHCANFCLLHKQEMTFTCVWCVYVFTTFIVLTREAFLVREMVILFLQVISYYLHNIVRIYCVFFDKIIPDRNYLLNYFVIRDIDGKRSLHEVFPLQRKHIPFLQCHPICLYKQ